LTVIDGHARRLMKGKNGLSSGEIDERSGKIRAAVLRLTHMIDNLLNSARLADGGAELYFQAEKMDLATVLREVCQLHREMVPNAQIMEQFAAASMPMVGDAKLLFQAFSNLVANAVKYSPAGGLIEVEARIDDSEAVIAVADRGIGIPAGDLSRLFERYYRGSNVSGIVGTGVGLYLVKTAVELHGGVIEVASKEGHGCRFIVRLPRRQAAVTEEWPRSAESVAVDAPSIADNSERVA
jgi:signal transduction histidine kinase